jgi:uroporphyrinogen decarboxylase
VTAPPFRDRFLRACRRKSVDRTPIWFMRQAGRYLPEFAEVRGERDVLETCRDPERAAELTLQPLHRMDVDAAIVFSDIMVPLEAVGVPVRIVPGVGPIVDDPVREPRDVSMVRALEPEADVPHVLETIRLVRKELDRPLIGFAGGPFTLASYLVEGGPSRTHSRTKAMMFGDPSAWDALMHALRAVVVPHLRAQVDAGAQALQLFDSWAGALSVRDYEQAVLPHVRSIFGGIADLGVPLIHFGVGTGELLPHFANAGADVVGLDWRTPLDVGWDRIGGPAKRAVQGNLDPAVLLAPWDFVEPACVEVLDLAAGRDGHVFNLGHGVLPSTPPEVLERLVDLVHEKTERSA